MNHENRQEQLDEWYGDEYFKKYPKHDRRITQIIRKLPLDGSESVCELGCGLGHILIALHDQIREGLGIDFSEYAVKEAKILAENRGARNLSFLSLKIEDLVTRPEFKGYFDKVLMMDISEHLYDDTLLKFFRSTAHLLKPEGELYLHTPNAEYLLEQMKKRNFILQQFPSHISVRSLQEYKILLDQAGFELTSHEFLPHYNPFIGGVDKTMMRVPVLKKFFRARLLLCATPR